MDVYELLQKSVGAKLTENPGLVKKAKGVCQLEVTGEGGGVWHLDFTKNSQWIGVGAREEARCTLKLSGEDLVALLEGRENGFALFTSKRLKVSGEMGLALKLNSILQG